MKERWSISYRFCLLKSFAIWFSHYEQIPIMFHLSRTIIVIGPIQRNWKREEESGFNENRKVCELGELKKKGYINKHKALFYSSSFFPYYTNFLFFKLFFSLFHRCPSSFQSRLESAQWKLFPLITFLFFYLIYRHVKLK